ncbi:hypothetical protein [Edaphobacter modestus]|uniref:hypothetical protein n=1 Tax=Edaphobacter modestus TaxID=388466 RepID=UPI0013EE6A4F|nr:hypothetical protein [Edaphobacter modestus]
MNYFNRPAERFEVEWQERFRNLQALICELVLKNEQLRMALASITVITHEEARERDG